MIKQYVFDNINNLNNFKLEIILPEIKNGRYITDIYLNIIKEISLKIFIRDIINNEFNIDISFINCLESKNILTINFKKDYIYNLLKDLYNINNCKFILNFNIDTNLDMMCIWNLEYSPHICGELIIN
jgi:hypothetical protein